MDDGDLNEFIVLVFNSPIHFLEISTGKNDSCVSRQQRYYSYISIPYWKKVVSANGLLN